MATTYEQGLAAEANSSDSTRRFAFRTIALIAFIVAAGLAAQEIFKPHILEAYPRGGWPQNDR